MQLHESFVVVAKKAKCSHCRNKGAVDFRLHYVLEMKGMCNVPAQNIRNVLRKTLSLLFQQAGKKAKNT